MTENSVVSCPPMLSCRRGESGSDFADKRALQPQSPVWWRKFAIWAGMRP